MVATKHPLNHRNFAKRLLNCMHVLLQIGILDALLVYSHSCTYYTNGGNFPILAQVVYLLHIRTNKVANSLQKIFQ